MSHWILTCRIPVDVMQAAIYMMRVLCLDDKNTLHVKSKYMLFLRLCGSRMDMAVSKVKTYQPEQNGYSRTSLRGHLSNQIASLIR